MLLPSIWWFTHDPQVYHDPEAFEPERYMSPRDEPDPRTVVFGFGRRICPGLHFADAQAFYIVSQLLSIFSFSKAIDEKGSEIHVEPTVRPGLIANLPEFPFRAVSRNAKRAELLRRAQALNPWSGSDAEVLGKIASEFAPVSEASESKN